MRGLSDLMPSLAFYFQPREQGGAMNPSPDAYTVAMPWYEKDDFDQLLKMSADPQHERPLSYDQWHLQAKRALEDMLARGKAVEVISVRASAFLEWAAREGLANDAAARRKYVEHLASATLVTREETVARAAHTSQPPSPSR
jgi:hypothetical protein